LPSRSLRRAVLAADGEGIDWMIAVALFVAHLPGAVGRMAAFGSVRCCSAPAGSCCLPPEIARCAGAAACSSSSPACGRSERPLPDVLVSSDGAALAVRGADGGSPCIAPPRRLLPSRSGSPPMATRGCRTTRRWTGLPLRRVGLHREARGRQARLAGHNAGRLRGGLPLAAVVVTGRELPGECKAIVIDRKLSRGNGAIALRRTVRASQSSAAGPPVRIGPGPAAQLCWKRLLLPPYGRNRARTATPRAEDLEAGD